MPDRDALIPIIQNTLSAGEISPALYGRTDLQKFHQSAATMRNFFVDYKGGASSRPGTQYIGHPGSAGFARLIPFIFSGAVGQSYMLVFSSGKIRFIKNPGDLTYPNSSNAGLILSGGIPYEVTTPYTQSDMRYLKFKQVADKLYVTRRGYNRKVLNRISDTNWTFVDAATGITVNSPVISNITISGLPAGSPDPQNTYYMYCVTAVDTNGNESNPSQKAVSATSGIDIGITQGTVSIFWSAVADAVWYKVYKALPTPGGKIPGAAEQMGFAGYSYGTVFTDSNIVPDFSHAPPQAGDPFVVGRITGYTITGSSADWPVNGTSITVTDATGTGAQIYAIIDNNTAGGVGHISGLWIADPGSGYTAPTLTASGGGTSFTATAILSAAGSNDPDAVGLFQQRIVYGSPSIAPNRIIASRPGNFLDFRKTNPVVDSDSYQLDIADEQVTQILWFQSMPGGLVIGTDAGVVQLTGGSSSQTNPVAVTPTSNVIIPQTHYGCADIHPIVIDSDILYVQAEQSIIRDLQYNLFVNIYTGTDVTVLSSHLFYSNVVLDWAYQDLPNKVVWAIRGDGTLLSLTYLKSQELMGWARHDSAGPFESVAVVREGTEDAIYFSVLRNGQRCIERLVNKNYWQIDDAWCLDGALSTAAGWKTTQTLTISGNDYTTDIAAFVAGDVGADIRVLGHKAQITAFISTTHVQATLVPGYDGSLAGAAPTVWRLDRRVTTVSGLDHLNGLSVYALADGIVQGPFVVVGGSITLTTAASAVVVGQTFICQLQQLYLDVGKEVGTIQGIRKKITAATVRVKDAARLKIGTKFSNVQEWKQGISSTDPAEYWPYPMPGLTPTAVGLSLGDQRIWLPADFNTVGSVCISQEFPLPATVLAIVGEAAVGDTL